MSDPHPQPTTGLAERLLAAGAELLSGVGTVCLGVALLWTRHESIVWQPPGGGRSDAGPRPAGALRLDYWASDGQALFAWIVEPASTPLGTLIAFHGNAELAAWGVPWAHEVARRTGWRVVLPEYRGYAGLGGQPSHAGSRRDAWAAYAALREVLPAAGAPLAVFGHSLGSAVAAELAVALEAARAPVGALLLQSPFSSIADMTRLFAGRRGAAWARLGRVHFDTRACVATLEAPVWVAHGACDLIIPQRMGRTVHAAARRRGEWLGLAAAGHNDVPSVGGTQYWAWLARALAAAGANGDVRDAASGRTERVVRTSAS